MSTEPSAEPSLVTSKPPIFVDHGDRIEITWPKGRGLFWTTPDAVEGWADQVNELRAQNDRLRIELGGTRAESDRFGEALTSLLAQFGHDERVRNALEAALTKAEMGRKTEPY